MKIAIVGLGGSFSDYVSAKITSQEFDEIWGINCIGGVIHVDKTFMMDPVSRFLDTENAGTQTGIARKFLKENKKPIITCQLDKRVKNLELFPLKEVATELGYCYFNNTVAYAVAYAIWIKATQICLYGIDYTYKNVNIVLISLYNEGVTDISQVTKYGIYLNDDFQVKQPIHKEKLENIPEYMEFFGTDANGYHPNEISAEMISMHIYDKLNSDVTNKSGYINFKKWWSSFN